MSAASASSVFKVGDDAIKDLGNGVNLNGLLGSDGGYDAGLSIGSAGLGKDDIQSFEFTLSSSARPLTLDDFANVEVGLRLTSVGVLGGTRNDSSKLLETTSVPINAVDDSAATAEDAAAGGNLFNNDSGALASTTTVAGWSGGALGAAISLDNAEGATLTLNADGGYSLDASAANRLSAGERLEFAFSYDARSSSPDQASVDQARFTIVVVGANDSPVAGNDAAAANENSASTGSVLANDSDIDRLDSIAVSAWDGGALGSPVAIADGAGSTVTLNADGGYVVDAAANALSAGEIVRQDFGYTLSDNQGATTRAVLSVSVVGANDAPVANGDEAGSLAENGSANGNVLSNDTDVDRLDTLTVSALNGNALAAGSQSLAVVLDSGAKVELHSDGRYTYDTNGAFASLLSGEEALDSFQYTVSDGQGGFATAMVNVKVLGEGVLVPVPPVVVPPPAPPPPPQPVGPALDLFPSMSQNISNVVLYLDDGNAATGVLKVKLQPEGLSIKDVDELKIFDFIQQHGSVVGGNTSLAGISIHAGQEYPNLAGTDGTAQGEGAFFFLLDNESPQVQPIGTKSGPDWSWDWNRDDVPLPQEALNMGITPELLGTQAQIVFSHFADGVWA